MLGIYVIFGVKLDIFQAVATRITWWVPNVLDSSGFGTGKSFRIWLVWNLRGLLIPGQQIVAYYQTFQSVKDIYWANYQRFGSNRRRSSRRNWDGWMRKRDGWQGQHPRGRLLQAILQE